MERMTWVHQVARGTEHHSLIVSCVFLVLLAAGSDGLYVCVHMSVLSFPPFCL